MKNMAWIWLNVIALACMSTAIECIGPDRTPPSYTYGTDSDTFRRELELEYGYDYGSEDWIEVEFFLGYPAKEIPGLSDYTPFSGCDESLKKFYNNKEDMSGWDEVTNELAKLKSKVSECETRLDKIVATMAQIPHASPKKTELLNKVTQARADLSRIREAIPAFEAKIIAVKQEKENELAARKDEIDRLTQSGKYQLTYSDSDVRVEFIDMFVNRQRVLPAARSSTKTDVWSVYCCVKLKLTVISKTKIVKPRTGYMTTSGDAYSSNNNDNVIIVNSRPVAVSTGIAMEDNFGNRLGLLGIGPFYEGSETERGLKPGEVKTFAATFNDEPLKNTESLTVKVFEGTLGNNKPFDLVIPKELIEIVLKEPKFYKN